MSKLLEYNIVLYLKNDKADRELEMYEDMGIEVPQEQVKEKIVKYSFYPKNIKEIRQSFVSYNGEWLDATVCIYSEQLLETPPLLVEYEEFKKAIDEYNKEDIKAV